MLGWTKQTELDSAGRLPQKRSVLAVSEGRSLLEVIEGSTEAHLMRFAKGLLPDMTKPPAEPVITSGRSSIHPKIRVPRGKLVCPLLSVSDVRRRCHLALPYACEFTEDDLGM